MVPEARCDAGCATADPTLMRLPHVEFSALSWGCKALMLPDGSWKNTKLLISLMRIRLMDELGRMVIGAGFWTVGMVSISTQIGAQMRGTEKLKSLTLTPSAKRMFWGFSSAVCGSVIGILPPKLQLMISV